MHTKKLATEVLPENNFDTINATQQASRMISLYRDERSESEKIAYYKVMDKPVFPSLGNFKSQARLLKLLSAGDISSGQALDMLSRQYDKKDWNTMKAKLTEGRVAEGTHSDPFVPEKVLPALEKWRNNTPQASGIYPKDTKLAELKLYEVLSALMNRSKHDIIYLKSLSTLIEQMPSLFSGYDISLFHPDVQKQEEWYREADLLDYMVRKNVTENYGYMFKACFATRKQGYKEYEEEILRIVSIINTYLPKRVHHFIQNSTLYSIPLSIGVKMTKEKRDALLNSNDRKKMEANMKAKQIVEIKEICIPFEKEYPSLDEVLEKEG